MSAVAIAIAENAIVAAADGASYNYQDGKLFSATFSKLLLLPQLDALISWTGSGAFGLAFQLEMGQQITGFDHLVEEFEEICWQTDRNLHRFEKDPRLTEVSVTLSGWSTSRERFEIHRLVNYGKDSVLFESGQQLQLEPFKRSMIESGIWCSHAPPAPIMEEYGLADTSNMDLVELVIRLICANRACSGFKGDPENDRWYAAGGFVQVAILQPGSAQTWIAHRWPDLVGEHIDLSRGDPVPQF